jgi:hypothetical protein
MNLFSPTKQERGQTLLTKEQLRNIVAPYALLWIFTPLIALFQGRYGMAIYLSLPWIALVIVLRHPRDFTLFVAASPRADRETYAPSITFLWLLSPLYFGFSPPFGEFVDPWTPFLRPALYVGGALFFATVFVVFITAPGWNSSFVYRFMPVLAASLMYGYMAARELDVMLDRSPDVIYQSRVTHRNAASGSVGLTIEPWGPVTVLRNVSVPHSVWSSAKIDGPICMVMRQGALKVPWYTAQACPWRGGRTDVGP